MPIDASLARPHQQPDDSTSTWKLTGTPRRTVSLCVPTTGPRPGTSARQSGGSVRFDQAGRQSRCVSRRHQAGESPIGGYERGDGWARIAADAACRRWHRGRWAASRRRTARRPPGPAGPAPQPGENRLGRSARSISWHARCCPHAGGPRPSPQPSPVPLAASAACPPGPVPPPGTGCGQPRRPAPVRRAGGGDHRPAAVRNPGSGGPSRTGSCTRPQPEPHHLDPSSGARVPRVGRGGQAVVHCCDCRPGMTSCHQVARPAQKGQSRSRHRGCLLAGTPAGGHPPRRRDPVPGPTAGDPELAGHPADAGGPGGAHRDYPGRPAHVCCASSLPPCRWPAG
jgi:hypothetical protein